MLIIEKAIRKRKCNICNRTIRQGENHIKFTGGSGRRTTTNNLCVNCCSRFVNENTWQFHTTERKKSVDIDKIIETLDDI